MNAGAGAGVGAGVGAGAGIELVKVQAERKMCLMEVWREGCCWEGKQVSVARCS